MASGTLLTLLDDIATLLDDVAVMSKVAAKKTGGVLGDDLALNAQQVSGIRAERELPVVWAVAKGSMVNKAILVPLALLISYWANWAILPLLMVGGAYLCFEGVEKLAHKFLHRHGEEETAHQQHLQAVANPEVDLVAFEKDKIKGAVRTDFILSAEIIVITLGTIATATLLQQMAVLLVISMLMTVGVYGFVGLIVKMDDAGLYLSQLQGKRHTLQRAAGHVLLGTAPRLMKFLSIAGTAAMFVVGGGIITHSLPSVHHTIEHAATAASSLPLGGLLHFITPTLLNIVAGLLTGALVLAAWTIVGSPLVQRFRKP